MLICIYTENAEMSNNKVKPNKKISITNGWCFHSTNAVWAMGNKKSLFLGRKNNWISCKSERIWAKREANRKAFIHVNIFSRNRVKRIQENWNVANEKERQKRQKRMCDVFWFGRVGFALRRLLFTSFWSLCNAGRLYVLHKYAIFNVWICIHIKQQ